MERLKKIQDYVEEHYMYPLSIGQMADEIGCLTAQAYRKFRDSLTDGKRIILSADEKDVRTMAREVSAEVFAGLAPVEMSTELAEAMLWEVIKETKR